jgi:ATP-binding cassette subfamily B multidrug efflux pump
MLKAPAKQQLDQAQHLLDFSLWRMMLWQSFYYWRYYLLALVSLVVTHWISSLLPFMAKDLAEKIKDYPEQIPLTGFFLLALGIVLFRTMSRLSFFYPARVMERDMRLRILRQFETQPPVRYEKFDQGAIYQLLSNDIEQIRALIGFALLQVGNVAIALIILIPKLTGFHADLLVALLPLMGSFILFTLILAKNREYQKKTMELQARVQTNIMEAYAGRQTIKNYQQEKSFIKLFNKQSFDELLNFYKAGVGISWSIPLIPLGIGLSLVWGAYVVKVHALGASALILFAGFVYLFMEPLSFISWIGVVFAGAHASWGRLRELVEAFKTPTERELFLAPISNSSPVNHQYISSHTRHETEMAMTLDYFDRGVDLVVHKNHWTILLGKTGAGKSTLMSQIGMWFKLRGINVGYVDQTPYIYNDTIEKNIFLGRQATEEEHLLASELLTLMELDSLADTSDGLLKLEVGEHGKNLSGGQAKRLCLVRSLLSGCQYLLWDDPFSSVDLGTERNIIQRLKSYPQFKGRTYILTGHRLSTAKACQEFLFLNREMGTVESYQRAAIDDENNPIWGHFEKQRL